MKCIGLLFALALSSKLDAEPVIKCADLAAVSFGKEVKIESAKAVTARAGTPGYCEVRGVIWPEAKFALELPVEWNGRFFMVGNGGLGGTINLVDMNGPLGRGFATASTDTGHDASKEPLATFARRVPTNPNADRKATDWEYLAVHETAVLSKEILKTFYGKASTYSYFSGCSGGGRQGLIEAQRFPDDFDGYIVGAPVLNLSGTHWRHLWDARVQDGAGAITREKLPLLATAVYAKCDGVDGLQDGLIDDPTRCVFDPSVDLPRCQGGVDGPSCFTNAQIEALKKIYGGVKDSRGKVLFPGQPLGAEVSAPGVDGVVKSGWDGTIVGTAVYLPLVTSYMQYMELDPPPGPSWDYRTFDFDTAPATTAKFAARFNATEANLSRVKRHGSKMIHYHGWADPAANALVSIDYYESVIRVMGAKETREFYRLFLVPGMFHCRGGVGCNTADWISAIADWVEKGVAPEKVIGAKVVDGQTKRTRPLCAYPEVARYKGRGSIDAAENFSCAAAR